ncbi:hypothetical protein [Paenibacillus sp. FSL H8-0079]|uniref:hypothetical protein n=1 Tax=Paenibacillus sp. FSL H8-0079 TaxID=2921375 RepID=UPI0030EB1756
MDDFVPNICVHCGGNEMLKVNWFYRDDEGQIISDKIPAYECQNMSCGEHTFTRESMLTMEEARKCYKK